MRDILPVIRSYAGVSRVVKDSNMPRLSTSLNGCAGILLS
jgi:hypothetical protein